MGVGLSAWHEIWCFIDANDTIEAAKGKFMKAIPKPALRTSRRRGAATLDYVLVLGAMLPLAGLTLYQSGRVIRAVYAFTCTFISWPFM
jgi:hypothetical protein